MLVIMIWYNENMRHAIKDSIIIILSMVLAIMISRLDLIEKLLSISENIRVISSFIGGLLFTSVFTTAPAIVFLGEVSQIEPIFIVALIGAIGAVCGDLLIFYLFKSHVANDLDGLMKRVKNNPLKLLSRNSGFRWVSILIGAFIIASPLPDELGIAMMGISRLKLNVFIPISLIFNFLGILAIGFASRLLV